jgi:hypothetical protein
MKITSLANQRQLLKAARLQYQTQPCRNISESARLISVAENWQWREKLKIKAVANGSLWRKYQAYRGVSGLSKAKASGGGNRRNNQWRKQRK